MRRMGMKRRGMGMEMRSRKCREGFILESGVGG